MAKAKKLPSGAWRTLVFSHTETVDGKKIKKYESFTAETKKESEFLAAEFSVTRKKKKDPLNITVGEAIDRYIEMKDAVLSPSTVREYKQERRNCLQGLMDKKLIELTHEVVQKEINKESALRSPKSVKNSHGLLSASLREFYPEFVLRTTLPSKKKINTYIPTKKEIDTLLAITKDTSLYVPILLASCLGLRRSEICALKWESVDFKKNTIRIEKAKVLDENNSWVIKDPKSYAGNRILLMPKIICETLSKEERVSEYIINIKPSTITLQFVRLLESENMNHFRFHDLRHYYASVMLALNIPDKYAMERMGHATNTMLKNIYQHTMDEKNNDINKILNSYFEENIQHEIQHKKK